MAQRNDLHEILKAILGSEYVYFQSPPNKDMHYPCIVYERDRVDIRYADNKPYSHAKRYQLTIIDNDPDSVIYKKVIELPTCSHDRSFIANNLYHDVYNLFF